MPGGRPTDYSDEILQKTHDYIENYSQEGDLIPSMAGLSVYLEVSRTTLYLWSKRPENSEFMYTLGKLKRIQEKLLLNGGLGSTMNSGIVKLALANHGYAEKQDHTSSDGSMSPQKKDFNQFYEEGTE